MKSHEKEKLDLLIKAVGRLADSVEEIHKQFDNGCSIESNTNMYRSWSAYNMADDLLREIGCILSEEDK